MELHTWLSRIKPGPDFKVDAATGEPDFYANYPDFLVFDVDPYIYSGKEAPGDEPELNRTAFKKTCQISLKLKEILDKLSLSSFVKTSGRTGLHIFIPVLRQMDFHGIHAAAETLSQFLWQQYPAGITTDWAVEKRRGKIFLDYNQNVRGKTLASVYSPRPSPEATVSIPLRWDELEKIYPTDFTIVNTPDRLADLGDLWSGILDAKVDLVKLLTK
jgi:bifunctional non-homologous end joining protein LigD